MSLPDAPPAVIAATQAFYARRAFQPAWLEGTQFRVEALATLSALARVEEDGLSPDAYPAHALRGLVMGAAASDPRTESGRRARAEAELLLTRSFLLLAHHLHAGRIPPAIAGWAFEPTPLALDEILERALRTGDVAAALDSAAPSTPEYKKLRAALAELRTVKRSGGWPTLDEGPVLQEGDSDERVAQLRIRLRASGELPPVVRAPDPAQEQLFDAAVTAALKTFQARHGLKPDGRLTTFTVAELNVPVERRIEQVVINLERLRWLPRDPGERHIVVNIPAFQLTAFEGGRVVMESPVVAGQPDWETPILADVASAVEVNPEWHVPARIARKDLVPLLRRKPSYPAAVGMRIYDRATGAAIDPATVDWKSAQARSYTFVQDAGAQNPLGPAKLVMHNRFQVYLHGTPSQRSFELSNRALSHGCVRVQKIRELVDWLLGDEQRSAEFSRIAQSGHTARLQLDTAVPLYLVYLTAYVDERGVLHTRPDIYRRDDALLEKLELRQRPTASVFQG